MVAAALAAATRATGADPALLHAIAWQESRFRHAARNSRSSASGLMQFTSATWLEVVRDHGAKHGLAAEAAALSTDPRTGTISARNHRILARILKLRFNPRLSAIMAAERLAAAEASLEKVIGHPPEPADLYVLHLLGPTGARRFLTELDRTPSRPAAEVVGADSLAANPGLFLDRGSGRKLSLREAHAAIGRLVAGPPIELAEAP